ncbi:uncharacterized protein LOC144428107 isoform X2 [Styela clava]
MRLLASSMQIDNKSSSFIGLADALVSETDKKLSTPDLAEKWLEQTFKLSETDSGIFRAIKAAVYDSTVENNRTLPLFFKLRREKDFLSSVWGRTANKKALNKVKMKNLKYSVQYLFFEIIARCLKVFFKFSFAYVILENNTYSGSAGI